MKTKNESAVPALPAPTGSERVYGVTHRGTDAQAKAYIEDGIVYIADGKGWLKCWPGVKDYFSPNDQGRAGSENLKA